MISRHLFSGALAVLLASTGLALLPAHAAQTELRLGAAAADVGNLDPHFASSTSDRTQVAWIFGALVRFAPGSTDPATIEPDLYVESRGWIIEAKKSSGRHYVRTAIGQVLDYVHVAEQAGVAAAPVVLLPSRPTPDLVALLGRHGITLIVRGEAGFEVLTPA